MLSKKMKIGIVAAAAVALVGVAGTVYAADKPSTGLYGNWIHVCVDKKSPYTWHRGNADNSCPSGQSCHCGDFCWPIWYSCP